MKLVTFLKSHHLILSQNKEDKKSRARGERISRNQKPSANYKAIYQTFIGSLYIDVKIIDIYSYINSNYFIYLHLLLYKRIEKRYNKSMKYH